MKFMNAAEPYHEIRAAQGRRHLPFHFYATSRNALIDMWTFPWLK